ncbi:MAG: hypothetical protein KAR13_05180 [Desulfobulbaceae bacterium]|nr:hypothetical protein [Desulfobulbaceae bacterium]
MSHFFDVFKRIRDHKAFQNAENGRIRSKKPRHGQKKYKLALVFVLVSAGIAFLYMERPIILDRFNKAGLSQEQKSRKVRKQPVADHTYQAEQAALIKPIHSARNNQTEQEMIKLNNQGAMLVQRQDYWNGIYYLEQAKKMQPEQIEPLLNQAVAFSEMGLYTLAFNLLEQAHHLAPNHPLLRSNLDILAQTGIFERPLTELFERKINNREETD